MKIRTKFTFMVGIPVAAIVVILAIGLFSFSQIRQTINEISELQNDRATMIDGDRDAYQAYLAEIMSTSAQSQEEIDSLKATSIENLDQTWERVAGHGDEFSENMIEDLNIFSEEFNVWRQHSEATIALASATVDGNIAREIADAAAILAFDDMRNTIDQIGELVDNALNENITLQRRRELETALSLVLNGDRDAYQGYVAQLLVPLAASIEEIEALDASSSENIGQTLDRVNEGASILGGPALALRNTFNEYFIEWRRNSRDVVALAKQNFADNNAIIESVDVNLVHFESMRSAIDRLGELQKTRVNDEVTNMNAMIANTTILYLAVALFAIALAVTIVIITAVRITRALRQTVQVADNISQGDLEVDLDVKQNDEIGQLADSMRTMVAEIQTKATVLNAISNGDLTVNVEKTSDRDGLGESLTRMNTTLNEFFSQVNEAVDHVSSGSDQIAQSSQSLSQGATEQASSLEEVSSSLAEIEGQTRKNVEYAEQGNSQMKSLVSAMEQINDSSDEIRSVVKVIDDIAFQINLLALNANVEAARAGKYGKGFAVVADEVRNLAVRSAEAVKETTQMVDETVKNIEVGNKLASATASQFEEMSASSKEQAEGVGQINEGLGQIDQVTQSNTASAEESAAAAEELSSQVQQLKSMIAKFKLSSNGSARTSNNLQLIHLYL